MLYEREVEGGEHKFHSRKIRDDVLSYLFREGVFRKKSWRKGNLQNVQGIRPH